MGEHDEFYKTFCQPQFGKLFEKIDDIHSLLKGKNGDPGMCDDIRDLKQIQTEANEATKRKKARADWLTKTLIGAVVVQLVLIGRQIIAALWK